MTTTVKKGTCQVCGSSHWHWTDHHGVALCGACKTTSIMLRDALPDDRKDETLPVSTLLAEWLPKYQVWWQESQGSCTFQEWLDFGARTPSAEELQAIRAEKEKMRVGAVLARPIILISDWRGVTNKDGTPYYHVGLYGTGIEKYLGEAVNLDDARKVAHSASNALEAERGHPISVVTKRNQGFQEWLDQDEFWGCHPCLAIQYARPGWDAYLRDPYGHGMRIQETGTSPAAKGKTPQEAVSALLDYVRGRRISFSGYHSGSFDVPSDLVMDWVEGKPAPEKVKK